MDETAEDLKVRTKAFAIAVLDYVDTLPTTPSGDTVARQLARAGLGTAGNYRGACRSRSHVEFTSRIGVVLEEADESELWLDVAHTRRMGNGKLSEPLLSEAGELRAIFSKASATARLRDLP